MHDGIEEMISIGAGQGYDRILLQLIKRIVQVWHHSEETNNTRKFQKS